MSKFQFERPRITKWEDIFAKYSPRNKDTTCAGSFLPHDGVYECLNGGCLHKINATTGANIQECPSCKGISKGWKVIEVVDLVTGKGFLPNTTIWFRSEIDRKYDNKPEAYKEYAASRAQGPNASDRTALDRFTHAFGQ